MLINPAVDVRYAQVAVLQPFLKTTAVVGRRSKRPGQQAVQAQDQPRPSVSLADARSKLDEAVALVDTLGCEVVLQEVGHRFSLRVCIGNVFVSASDVFYAAPAVFSVDLCLVATKKCGPLCSVKPKAARKLRSKTCCCRDALICSACCTVSSTFFPRSECECLSPTDSNGRLLYSTPLV